MRTCIACGRLTDEKCQTCGGGFCDECQRDEGPNCCSGETVRDADPELVGNYRTRQDVADIINAGRGHLIS